MTHSPESLDRLVRFATVSRDSNPVLIDLMVSAADDVLRDIPSFMDRISRRHGGARPIGQDTDHKG